MRYFGFFSARAGRPASLAASVGWSRAVRACVVAVAMAAALPASAGAASWAIQPTPNPVGGTNDVLRGVSCVSATACIAVGSYEASHGATLAESWDGTTWTIQTTPSISAAFLTAVSCTSATACTAVGGQENSTGGTSPLAERWDGSSWSLQATPTIANGELDGVSCASAVDCTAVGTRATTNGDTAPLLEVWNGTSWSVHPTQTPPGAFQSDLQSVSCTSASFCDAVGYYDVNAGNPLPWAERWNGISWTLQPVPTPAGTVISELPGTSCVATLTGPGCTAVGYYFTGCTAITPCALHTLVERRTGGGGWKIQSAPDTPAVYLFGVSCASASSCQAVGEGAEAEGWNGTSWSVQPTPALTSGHLGGVSCTAPTACTAVGDYFSPSAASVTLAERYS
jgi:hypothetical protein